MHAMGRRRLLTAAAAAAGLGLAGLARVARAASRPVRMAYFESYAPFSYRDDDGQMKGLLIDGMDLLARSCDIAVTHQGFPWGRAQFMVRHGELDGFCTVPTSERQAYAHFSAVPLVVVRFGIFHRADDPRPAAVRSIADLAPFANGSYIGNGWTKENLPGQDIHWVTDEETLLRMIALGRLDIYLSGELTTWHRLRSLGLTDKFAFTPAPYLPWAEFAVGLRRSYPDEAQAVAALEQATRAAKQSGALERLEVSYAR